MVPKQEDRSPLSVPFMPGELRNGKDEEVALNYDPPGTENISFFKTCLNGINALSGIGTLSVPYALSNGGWLSLILLLLIAAAAFYAGLLMKKCMEMNPDIRTYPDIGEHAFGKNGRLVLSISMFIELYLVATGSFIIEGESLNNIFPNMGLEMAGIPVGRRQFFVILVSLVIMPSVWLDNLSILSYVSASGVFASAITLGSIFWTTASGEVGFDQKGTVASTIILSFPTAVSLYAFCYCAHPVFPTLYNSMRNKHQFTNVLLVCFVLSTLGYASMAILGYHMVGSILQSQLVTLNFPKDKISSGVATYTTLVNPISKYALIVTPIKNSLKELLPHQYKNKLTNILLGTTLVINTVIVALAIPYFGYLVGALHSVTASIILPCLCYLKISGTYRRFSCEMVAVVAMISMAVAIGVFVTHRSLRQLIEHL